MAAIVKKFCKFSTGYRGTRTNSEFVRKSKNMNNTVTRLEPYDKFDTYFNRINNAHFPIHKGFINVFLFNGNPDTVEEEIMFDKSIEWRSFFSDKMYFDSIKWFNFVKPVTPFGVVFNKQFNNIEYFDDYNDLHEYILNDIEKYF